MESLVGKMSCSFRLPQYLTTAIFTGAVQVTILGLSSVCELLETGAIVIYYLLCKSILINE